MDKTTTYTKATGFKMRLTMNDKVPDTDLYAAITVHTTLVAIADDGGYRTVESRTVLGTPRETEFSASEVAAVLQGSGNALGDTLSGEFVDIFTEAIGGIQQSV